MSTQTKLRTVTAEQASALWADLRGSFINAEKRIVEIIELKAWEPLGFESFAEAWASKMHGIRLATEEVRAHVVYADVERNLLPAAAGLGGAGFPAPESGIPAPGAPNETRSE